MVKTNRHGGDKTFTGTKSKPEHLNVNTANANVLKLNVVSVK